MKWNQSIARKHLLREDTMNPTIAAKSLLGRSVVRRAARRIKRRRFHRDNPLPALAALAGASSVISKIPVIGGFLKTPSEKRAAAVAPGVIQSANAGNLVAVKGIMRRTQMGIAKERAVWQAALAQIRPELVQRAIKQDKSIPEADHKNPETFAQSVMTAATMYAAAGGGATMGAADYLTPGLVTAVAKGVSGGSRRRSSRSRYPTYVDRYGRQRYSTKPPGSEMRLPVGATASAGSPYSFFRGAVGKGGVGTTAAQLGVAAAAGAAAYFGTKAILKYFGGRAVKKEEAGVQLALAARAARYEYAIAHNLRGDPPSYGVPASVIREIGAGMKAKLAELGYDEHGVRKRSGVENFMVDYSDDGDE